MTDSKCEHCGSSLMLLPIVNSDTGNVVAHVQCHVYTLSQLLSAEGRPCLYSQLVKKEGADDSGGQGKGSEP